MTLADELIEQCSAFLVGCGVPDGVQVDVGEERKDAFELVDSRGCFWLWFTLPLERGELSADAQVFGVEALRRDSVSVVELEQLSALGFEFADSAVAFRLAPVGVLPDARPALHARTDRGLQFTVVSDQAQAQRRATQESLVRESRHVAPLPRCQQR